MIPDRLTPIIFLLKDKLIQPVFFQQKPKWTGGRTAPVNPTLPWATGVRPPVLANQRQAYLQSLALSFKKIPVPVHELKPRRVSTFIISGITKDSAGTPIAGCTVNLFRIRPFDLNTGEMTYTFVNSTLSDANGYYYFYVNSDDKFSVTAQNAGNTMVGATINNLTGA